MAPYCPNVSTYDITFTLQIYSKLHFHHAGMTLPGKGFGMGEQEPNALRMVVSAWASTAAFVGLGVEQPSLVLIQLIAVVCSVS